MGSQKRNPASCAIVELVDYEARAVPAHSLSQSWTWVDPGVSSAENWAKVRLGVRISLLPVLVRGFRGYTQAGPWQVWGLSHEDSG